MNFNYDAFLASVNGVPTTPPHGHHQPHYATGNANPLTAVHHNGSADSSLWVHPYAHMAPPPSPSAYLNYYAAQSPYHNHNIAGNGTPHPPYHIGHAHAAPSAYQNYNSTGNGTPHSLHHQPPASDPHPLYAPPQGAPFYGQGVGMMGPPPPRHPTFTQATGYYQGPSSPAVGYGPTTYQAPFAAVSQGGGFSPGAVNNMPPQGFSYQATGNNFSQPPASPMGSHPSGYTTMNGYSMQNQVQRPPLNPIRQPNVTSANTTNKPDHPPVTHIQVPLDGNGEPEDMSICTREIFNDDVSMLTDNRKPSMLLDSATAEEAAVYVGMPKANNVIKSTTKGVKDAIKTLKEKGYFGSSFYIQECARKWPQTFLCDDIKCARKEWEYKQRLLVLLDFAKTSDFDNCSDTLESRCKYLAEEWALKHNQR